MKGHPLPAAHEHRFVLQIVQPGLLGLMDGSVSTLAPLFAAAALTGESRDAFFVGLAASIGAAISMGLAEALSDDGVISGGVGRYYGAVSPVWPPSWAACSTPCPF